MTSPSDIANFDDPDAAFAGTAADAAVDGERVAGEAGIAAGPLRIEIVSDGNRFRDLADDWRALAGRAGNGHHTFQTFGWCITWWDTCCEDTAAKDCYSLRILAGWDGDRLVMVWPLVVNARGPFAMAQWLGMPLTQYGDVLVEQNRLTLHWLAQGWDAVCGWSDIDAVYLRKVRRDSPLHEFLAHRTAEVGVREQAPFIDFTRFSDWDAYRSTLKSKSRKQQNRFVRNLEKAGTVAFEVDASATRSMSLAGEALDMKRAWLASTGKLSTAIEDEASGDFLDGLVAYDGGDLKCHVAALMLDDRPIAIEIGLAAEQHYCSFIGAYDPEFGHLRPGNVELEMMIRWTIESRFAGYDLLAPNDTYKQRWSTDQVEISDFGHAVSLRGKALVDLYMKRLRPGLKRLYVAMPTSLRTRTLGLLSRIR